MSSKSQLSSGLMEDYRYPALGEVEDFLYNASDNLKELYHLDLDIQPHQDSLNTLHNGTWSEVSEEYTAASEDRSTTFQAAIRDYYEDPDIPPTFKERTSGHEKTRELRLMQIDGDSTLFNLIADEVYEELRDSQTSYKREDPDRIHQFKL